MAKEKKREVNKVVAAILALFLGGLGIHKFYLGQVKQGVLYFVFFWTFIPAILAFIDAVRYLTMDDNVFESKYSY